MIGLFKHMMRSVTKWEGKSHIKYQIPSQLSLSLIFFMIKRKLIIWLVRNFFKIYICEH